MSVRTPLWPSASFFRPRFVPAVLITLVVAGLNTYAAAFTNAVTLPQQAPANDNFRNAQTIVQSSGVVHSTNVGATKEAGELNHAGNAGGASVWYRWQAPTTARFTFTTFRSDFNTLLAVYTGDSLPGIPVVSNDNGIQDILSICFDRTSTVSFNAIGGVVYRIAVDRNSSDTTGNIVLRWGRSASISGAVTSAGGSGGGPVLPTIVNLKGDTCRDSGPFYTFNDVPIGGSYFVDFRVSGVTYKEWDSNASISPLQGDVSNFNFFQDSPASNIVGKVTGTDESGLTVTCVSHPVPNVSAQGFLLGNGVYQCTALPVNSQYLISPAKISHTFAPASRTQVLFASGLFNVDFTATFVLQLLLDDVGQVAALDSVLLMRDPFPVIHNFNLLHRGVDRNTRIAIFLSSFQLEPGESPSSVVINLVGSNSQSYDIPAEDVRPMPDGFTRVTFRLPDTLTVGTCTLLVKARGLTSNIGALRIRS